MWGDAAIDKSKCYRDESSMESTGLRLLARARRIGVSMEKGDPSHPETPEARGSRDTRDAAKKRITQRPLSRLLPPAVRRYTGTILGTGERALRSRTEHERD